MSQYDTGLGWSAKSEWLMNTAGQVASFRVFGGEMFPGQPLPTGITLPADVLANGLKVAHVSDPNPNVWFANLDFYAAAQSGEAVIYASTQGSGLILVGASPTQGTTILVEGLNNNSGSIVQELSIQCASYDAESGLYWSFIQSAYISTTTVTYENIPTFSTHKGGLQHIEIVLVPVFKLNDGVACVCAATWLSGAGEVMHGPIAISSDPLYCVLSEDGQTPSSNMASDSILYDGMRFYITTIAKTMDAIPASGTQAPDLSQFGAMLNLKRIFAFLRDESFSNIRVVDAPDPYGENAEEEGGAGDDPDDDPVEEETMPLPAVVGLGFSTIYVPSQTDLFNLAAYLWGGNLDLDNFLKLFANPMDSILGLSAVPLVLSGTYEPVYLGGQQLQGITMPRYTGRTAVKVDMGTVTIKERWGAYLDYDPYTELAVYVPFVGIKNIKADDVMGKTIRLMYDIDILSGACIAYIRPEGESPLYEWSGQCAMQIPITGANWDNIFSTAINTVATLGGALFAPASAPVLGGAVASAASQAIAAKPRIERSGAVNGITGFLGQLRPYIIRTIPEAYIPDDQNAFIGYPSYMSVGLGSLTGYNEIASVHLENIPATGDELAELESILKGGAIF